MAKHWRARAWACPAILTLCCTAAISQELWQSYRDDLMAEAGLARLYTFEGVTDSSSPAPSLIGDEATLTFVPYTAKDADPVDDLEIVPGRWPGKTAVRLDQGRYEGPPFDATEDGFTIECWVRENGAGTLQPRGPNGTLLSASSGYYDGWRIVFSGQCFLILKA